LKAREAIRKAQEILEQKQRAEEDMLLQVIFKIDRSLKKM
jgi:hypothetical protein